MAATDISDKRTPPQDLHWTRRIKEQHQFINAGLGFLLPPDVEAYLVRVRDPQTPVCIAEVACGAGTWLEDVVQQLSLKVQVNGDAFHVPVSNSPKDEIVAQDVTGRGKIQFRDFNITSRALPPAEFVGKYDVVAVRLLHTSLPNDDWDNCIRNLISLLKPGGSLCWTDWDPLTARIAATKPGARDDTLRDVFRRFSDVLRERRVGNTYRIPRSMEAHGLEDIDSDIYPIPPSFEFTQNLADGAIALLEQTADIEASEMRSMRSRVDEELDAQGCLLWYDLWCHIGKKPSKARSTSQ